jgi:photosystem II stability/assembly factor-like uncharacterized protein
MDGLSLKERTPIEAGKSRRRSPGILQNGLGNWARLALTLLLIGMPILFISFASVGAYAAGSAEGQPDNDLLLMPAAKTVPVSKGLFLDVVQAGSRAVAVGEWGRIIYSDDGGAAWTQANVPVSVTLTAACFPTAQQGWAVGHDGAVLHSSDAGVTWVRQFDVAQFNAGAYAQLEKLAADAATGEDTPGNEDRAKELDIYVKDMALIKKEGSTWPFLSVWFADEREGFAVGTFGMAAHTVDGGLTWEPILDRIPNYKGSHYYGITQVGRDLFLVGEAGAIFRSQDRGQHWERLKAPYDGTFFGVIGSRDGNTVIVYGMRGRAFRSTDRGETWTPLAAPVIASWMGASLLSNGSLLLISPGLGGAITGDNGLTFQTLPNFPLGATAATGIINDKLVVVGATGALSIPMNGSGSNGAVQ